MSKMPFIKFTLTNPLPLPFWQSNLDTRYFHTGVEPKIRGFSPKMDGENNGKPYEQMDDLGGFTPLFLVQHPYILIDISP